MNRLYNNLNRWYENCKDSYNGLKEDVEEYWSGYGGISALLSSPVVHLAIVINLFFYDQWGQVGWWKMPISVMPNILGFSLGGYAILLGFGSETFHRFLSEKSDEEEKSPFSVINAGFVHFIFMQAASLIFAIFFSSGVLSSFKLISVPLWFLGHFLFIYALLLSVSTTFSVFRSTIWYEVYSRNKKAFSQEEE